MTPDEGRRFSFDAYVLDLERGSLLRDGQQIALRPKGFAVLLHLVSNAGRLVSKDELFAAAWPGVTVTDDALVQIVGELRRALGADGARLIATVPRRGYRFEAEVAALPPTADGEVRELQPSRPRRNLAFAIAAVLVMLGAAVAWTAWPPSGPDPRAPQDTTSRPVVAILPFSAQVEDGAPALIAEATTRDLIAALGRFSALTVMSWNAVAQWQGRAANPSDVAARLGARYQVEGRVLLAGGQVAIVAQLVDANGRVLWSARYEDALGGLFALQSRMTSEIAGALAIRVTQAEQQRVSAKPPSSLEAYDYVLRARPALQRPSRAALAEARTLLRRAVEVDPLYPAAHAGLAEADYIAVSWGWAESPAEMLARAEAAAARALRLNDTELRARIVLGRIQLAHGRYELARAEMERAIAINPSDAHALGGLGNALAWLGQHEAAIEALERAQRIDPDLSAIDRFALAMAYYLAGRFDAAIDQALANVRTAEEAVFNHVLLAVAYGRTGRRREAEDAVATIRRVYPFFDAETFGSKLRRPEDVEQIRAGLRVAWP